MTDSRLRIMVSADAAAVATLVRAAFAAQSARCGFVETSSAAHSGYAQRTSVNVEKRLPA